MIPVQFVIGLLFGVGSYAQNQLILEYNQLNDVLDELKLLRKEVQENRKYISKQDGELKAIRLELEETKRYCQDGLNIAEEKSKTELIKDFSEGTKSTNIGGDQSKTKRIISPTNPPTSHDGPIAFYAYMSTTMTHIGGHHTLIFDVIKSNSGHGLHPTTGVFTAPKSGFYVFTWTIRVFNKGYEAVELIVNGRAFGALFLHSGEAYVNDMSSTSAVVHVNEGEDVFLRTEMNNNSGQVNSDVYGYSSFAGWMLT